MLAGRTLILLVLSCRGSSVSHGITYCIYFVCNLFLQEGFWENKFLQKFSISVFITRGSQNCQTGNHEKIHALALQHAIRENNMNSPYVCAFPSILVKKKSTS